MSHEFERMKRDTMTDSNHTSQPAGSDREEVLEVCPACNHPISEHGKETGCNHIERVEVGATVGNCYCPCSRLPNAPAPQARSQASFMHHVGNWKCLRCPFEVPYDPLWFVMSDAINAHYKEKHPYVASNAPAFLADPEPSPAPSQPKLPDYTEEGRKEADTWFAGADKNDQQILFMDWKRLERENQQLRQQLDQAGEVLTKYEEQLAQIKEYKGERPKGDNHE